MLIEINSITSWLTDIFEQAGCPSDEARLIAVHLVDADASGHPSRHCSFDILTISKRNCASGLWIRNFG